MALGTDLALIYLGFAVVVALIHVVLHRMQPAGPTEEQKKLDREHDEEMVAFYAAIDNQDQNNPF